ncbi:MAG: addiction module antitoxin [Gammaproteobacteria bacterium]|nr:addiction module antitoxin [Gammaproteobacteria bacterium]
MTKTVQMSIKMESDLHQQFVAVAANLHTPAAQVMRQLMRRFIIDHETPNATTIAAMQATDRGEGKRFKSANDLFEDLGM